MATSPPGVLLVDVAFPPCGYASSSGFSADRHALLPSARSRLPLKASPRLTAGNAPAGRTACAMERSLHEHGGGIGSRGVADSNHSADGGKSAAVPSAGLPHTVAPR